MPKPSYVHGSRYEKDFLIRTLGTIAHEADVALTELVANSSDAGASEVRLTIPTDLNGELRIGDNGAGMTPDEFHQRWMTLSYDRRRHQGAKIEWPPGRTGNRIAYGRNGVGRHGLLCFSDQYRVITQKNGILSEFHLATTEGENPFVILEEKKRKGAGHGTTLLAIVERNLPKSEMVRQILTSRFVFDPSFQIFVNDVALTWSDLEGKVDERVLRTSDGHEISVTCFDTAKAATNTLRQGVAIWVNRRLVGDPSWTIGRFTPVDGRTNFARRYTIIARCDALLDDVLPDWSALGKGARVDSVTKTISDYVEEIFRRFSAERIEETKATVFRANIAQIKELPRSAQHDVVEFVEKLVDKNPAIQSESLNDVVATFVAERESKSMRSVIEKIRCFSESDLDGLNRLLSEWTVTDALAVLDEVDQRISIIEAIDRMSGDPATDELHKLHPLVTEARWLFGPEFDSPEYASNVSIRNAVEKVLGDRRDKGDFLNHLKRADLLVLKDATLSAVGLDVWEPGSQLKRLKELLLIEVKRGNSTITREHMSQAENYIEDIIRCGLVEPNVHVTAYVVGHRVDDKAPREKGLGPRETEYGRIRAVAYGQLTRSAQQRLFGLRDRLQERYGTALDKAPARLRQLVGGGVQQSLPLQVPAAPPAA